MKANTIHIVNIPISKPEIRLVKTTIEIPPIRVLKRSFFICASLYL